MNFQDLKAVIHRRTKALLFSLALLNLIHNAQWIPKIYISIESCDLQFAQLILGLPHPMCDALRRLNISGTVRDNDVLGGNEGSHLPTQ